MSIPAVVSASPSFDAIQAAGAAPPFVFTCEHAGREVPGGFAPGAFPEDLLDSHDGWDPGVAGLVHALAVRFGSGAVLGRYTRLLVDLNRAPREHDYIRVRVDGRIVPANQALSPREKDRRTREFYEPYHAAVGRAIAGSRNGNGTGRGPTIVSVHSFTPVWRGRRRGMEFGVLFSHHPEPASIVGRRLARAGRIVAYNAPYSGRAGKIFSASFHGRRHGLPFLEIEVRNDLFASEPDRVERTLGDALAAIAAR